MAFNDDNGSRPPKVMHQGNWTCSKCGGAITELPFEPAADRVDQLKCRDCFVQKRGGRMGGGARRPMVQGNWTCSKCGSAITELPFEPDPSRVGGLLCRDCHRERRESFN